MAQARGKQLAKMFAKANELPCPIVADLERSPTTGLSGKIPPGNAITLEAIERGSRRMRP